MNDIHAIVDAYTDGNNERHNAITTVIPGQVILIAGFLHHRAAAQYQQLLMQEINWQSEQVTLFGKTHTVPRLMAWHGDDGAAYRYSGVDHTPLPWTGTLGALKTELQKATGVDFNSVLLNLYRHGNDSMGWHSDDEPELGRQPTIASISLGQERRLRFRNRHNTRDTVNVSLPHGSLLLMAGDCQHQWQHHLPKMAGAVEPRINLTFRKIQVAQ